MERSYEMGSMQQVWKSESAKSITFIVTEDCNLICKYCYLTGKNQTNKMNFETAKIAIDYILKSDDINKDYEAVIWDFIGGEPFIEIDLIDEICEYIKLQMFLLDHKWFDFYRFNFSTNGILYDDPKVQKFIYKNKNHLSIGITIDGTKEKHDLNRIYKDGKGSYEDVVKNINLWQKQFPLSTTKVTFASTDLPLLKDSIIHLWNLGLKSIPANVVFEDVWNEGDDLIFEKQLKELADYILENDLWKEYSVRFFDEMTGHPLNYDSLEKNSCGSGQMMAIDYKGDFFPCVRFADYSLSNRKSWKIGDIFTGLNHDRIRPFLGLNIPVQSNEECVTCKVASNCAWCQGCNYDMADSDTIYQRATFICKMHKANSRANQYFWTKFKEKTGIISEYEEIRNSRNRSSTGFYLQFITSDDITPHCNYKSSKDKLINIMSEEVIKNGISFADENNMIPLFLTNTLQQGDCISGDPLLVDEVELPIYKNSNLPKHTNKLSCILLVTKDDLNLLSENVINLFMSDTRINIIIQDIETWTDLELDKYENQLNKISLSIISNYNYLSTRGLVEISTLTDIFDLRSMDNCEAGTKSYTLAPNGNIYLCPAFYFENPDNNIGNLDEGIDIKNPDLLDLKKAPICNACDAYHCQRCKYLNKKLTGEYNTPSRIQCIISHIERRAALNLQKRLKEKGEIFENNLQEIDYLDPLTKIFDLNKNKCI